MPTVIDSLVVELGLDPKKLTDGQKSAVESFKKTIEDSKKGADAIERHSERIYQGLGKLKTQILTTFALFLGGKGAKEFVEYITTADAATGRLSRQVNTSTENLGAWGNAAKLVGGTVQGMYGSINGLVQQFQRFSLTGESSVIPYFRALGIAISDDTGKMRSMDAILLDLADKFRGMDPARAQFFGNALGFDQGTINLLMQGREAVAKTLADIKAMGGPTDAAAKRSQELQESWAKAQTAAEGVGRTLVQTVNPAIRSALDYTTSLFTRFNSWLNSNDTWVDALDRKTGGAISYVLGGSKPQKVGYEILKDRMQIEQAKSKAAEGNSNAGGSTVFASYAEKEKFIRDEAAKRGIDPDIAIRVAKSEGFFNFRSTVIRKDGTREPSYGAFQLYTGGGLGNSFQKETGLDPSDPANEKETIKYGLDQARRGGWGPWHGWKGLPWAGIGPMPAPGAGPSTTTNTTNTTNIQSVVINTKATDGAGVARDFRSALERSNMAAQSNYGQQ